MTDGPRYTDHAVLHDGPRTRVVRARDGDRPVILKQLRGAWPDESQLRRMRREHDLLAAIDGDGAPRALRVEVGEVAQLVIEDGGAVSLDSRLPTVRASAADAIAVAIGAAEALAAVHARGVLHRDINPTNLVVTPDGGVMLIDFDLASPVPSRRAAPLAVSALEGTPPYLAPEQTGRMNRPVDARSDLYALGVTLYELFGGAPPFARDDLLGYAHAHLAAEPPRLVPIVDDLPEAIVDLVMTLLRKRPEERYQSAEGVAADLRAARDGRAPSARVLGSHPRLPQTLVGRSEEVAALTDAFEAICRGGRVLALVSGPPGVGKTSLVHELTLPVTIARGRLLEGKHDQFARDVPFAALRQVLSGFAAEVLSSTDDEAERWRLRLLEATAPNTALLLDLAPALGALLGPQEDVVELGPTEAERRLQETLRRALRAMARADHPLVVFLDDLQWADLPSLRVVEALFRDPELRYLLLVGAWRDNEVEADQLLLPEVRETVALSLAPLGEDDVGQLLQAALGREADELASALYTKTRGNPFFLGRLVDQAGAAGAIRFDVAQHAWTWDLDAMRALAVTDNVVDHLRGELERLPEETQRCLAVAALLGDRFDAAELAAVGGSDAGVALAAAVEGQFVQPLDDDYWAGSADGRFAFVHDRVQQAARELVGEDERRQLQLTIARGLDPQADPFRAAEHYGAALAIVEEDERPAVLQVHLRAGRRALRAAAHAPAQRLLETAIALASDLWQTDAATARELWTLAARAAWLAGDRPLLEQRVAALREHARDIVDVLRAEEIVVQASIAAGELQQALDEALDVLGRAGIALPRHPTKDDVGAAIGETLGEAHEIASLPDCEDALELAARGLLIRISSAAYVSEPDLLPLIACTLVRRTVRHGASSASAYGYGVFSLCLCAGWLLELGTQHGRHAIALQERFGDRALYGLVRHVVDNFARVWNDPLRDVYEDNPTVFRALMDVGDLEYAGWLLHFRAIGGLFSGVPLDELRGEVARATEIMRLQEMHAALACTRPFAWLVAGLRGEADDFDVGGAIAAHAASGFRAAELVTSVCALIRRVAADEPAPDGMRVMQLADGAVALFYQAPMRVYAALAILSAGGDVDVVRPWREALAAAQGHDATNTGHLLALFDAVVAEADGDEATAIARYDAAIDAASGAGFVHDEAIACERAGRFHLARGSRRIARAYLLEARFAWQRWGATACVARLDDTHGELLGPALARAAEGMRSTQRSTTSSVSGEQIDLASVLKASHAIADELTLESLLTRSMAILLENVGAQRGVLLLTHRGELRAQAIGELDGEIRAVDLPLDEARVPLDVVRRVWRLGEFEVRDEPSSLCAPVTHRGRVLGVLHFSNELVSGAFTEQRLRVLDVLAPQLAISVRNVRLLEAQNRFVPHQFLRSLDRHDIVDVAVGDHKLTEVTVFFSDIWGFTPLVESLSASEALGFINRYLSHAEPAITDGGGFIDTYLGDGIMALFDTADLNAQQAVAAAIEMHRALDRFNAGRAEAGLKPVRTGVGLNTGDVTLATIGGQRSLKCGVVGDAVNLASRVERLSRRSASRLLVSDRTVERLARPDAFSLRRTGRVRVRGRVTPLTVYEVLDAEPPEVRDARRETLDAWEAALDAYFAGEAIEARQGFARCIGLSADDPLPARYLGLVNRLIETGVPPGWDGIETLERK